MEVKGFDIVDHPRRVTVNKQRSEEGSGRSLTSPAWNSDDTMTEKDGPRIAEHDHQNQLVADFSEVIEGFDDEDRFCRISNSNDTVLPYLKGTAGNIEERSNEEPITENLGQGQFATVMEDSGDGNLRLKGADAFFTGKQEINFEMGWVEKSYVRKGGPIKTRGKEKGKLNGPSLTSTVQP